MQEALDLSFDRLLMMMMMTETVFSTNVLYNTVSGCDHTGWTDDGATARVQSDI